MCIHFPIWLNRVSLSEKTPFYFQSGWMESSPLLGESWLVKCLFPCALHVFLPLRIAFIPSSKFPVVLIYYFFMNSLSLFFLNMWSFFSLNFASVWERYWFLYFYLYLLSLLNFPHSFKHVDCLEFYKQLSYHLRKWQLYDVYFNIADSYFFHQFIYCELLKRQWMIGTLSRSVFWD